ncbi:alpha/beta hydrolase [Sphingomonas sp. TDK1]|uniref:alpha/beta hydrolase n=1 Tax=Sphingomonas sp. TDK1 TaxID=453247 RepID=UPI0007D9B190|nr:alpha/beta hydrolase [Sphingomonas sp. TDK1]OAN58486.1 alpha/beta hydrolase [Sphingomonas sp. TDK1]
MTDATPRDDVAAFLAYLAESAAPPLSTLPVEAARLVMRANCAVADAPPVPLARIEDAVVPGPAGVLAARLYDRRAERGDTPLILFFHGGGFVIGDLETHHSFCTWLADTLDLPLLAIDYRRAPEHPFPAAVDDAEAAARWVAQEPQAFGFRVTGLIPCGDSAGGNLAIVTTQRLDERPAGLPVRACWALYPYVGGGTDWPSFRAFGEGYFLSRADMAWFDAQYGAPEGDPRHDCVHGPTPPVPLLVHTAGLDPLRDAALAYADRVAATGTPVQRPEACGMIHGFVNFRQALPSAQKDCAEFARAAKAMLADLRAR